MSDFNDLDDDLELGSDEEFGSEEEFDANFARWAKHSEVSTEVGRAVQDSKDRIRRSTNNEFVVEAIEHATMLKHMLGDADPVVAEHTTQIISNLQVVCLEMERDPAGFLLSFIRAQSNGAEMIKQAQGIASRLHKFADEVSAAEELKTI